MAKIQELTEMLANQIAAGEVVERPASVVKELVENAIDAGSTQIDIFVEEAGVKKIEVIDNGEGILSEDVVNAFKRHATSKIHTRDDLFRIRTLGFRGEALPSIASVSELVVETSTGEDVGARAVFRGGHLEEQQPFSMRKGTKITVENLFYNTPARLKYMRSLQTELAKIGDIVNRLALSHPDIAFRLVHDGNKMITTLGNGDLKQAIAGIYGISTAKKMIEIEAEDLDFKVTGYISLPELTRASKNYLTILVNGRYIKNFLLNKAIIEGYGSKLMVGRYPITVIQIEMDPLLIDVNVHPTKQEVRLSKEQELMALISKAIQEALQQVQLIPKAGDSPTFKRKLEDKATSEQLEMPLAAPQKKSSFSSRHAAPLNFKEQGLAYDAKEGKFYTTQKTEPTTKLTEEKPTDTVSKDVVSEEAVEMAAFADPFDEQHTQSDSTEKFESMVESTEAVEEKQTIEESTISTSVAQTESKQRNEQFPALHYIGQMHGTYLFAESPEGMYIIDQHAAQERIKYEIFRKKIGKVGSALQELLVPIVLEYPQSDFLQIREKQELLEKVGIFLEEFGQNTFVVRSHPTWFPKGEEESVIREMIDFLLIDGKIEVAKFREKTAIMMSCKQSIKANHHLDERQAKQLLHDLAYCENPYNCPHGRPVLIHFSNKDMEKMFKRIQDPH